jgi:hypothetical protein
VKGDEGWRGARRHGDPVSGSPWRGLRSGDRRREDQEDPWCRHGEILGRPARDGNPFTTARSVDRTSPHERRSPMSTLPSPVKEFVDVVNAHDDAGFLDAFTAEGVVDDWGREFAGRDAIKAWSDQEFIGATGTMEVQRVDVDGSRVVVVADWRSTHANGLSEFAFDTDGDRISRMTIRGAE